MLPLEVEDKHS
jgi:hypothetical protein